MSILSDLHFHNEQAAYQWVEARLWPNGPECPRCGEQERVGQLKGKSTRPGVYKCYKCRKPFTVKVGTIFESSHIPLRIWLQAIHLMASSKKGISANQINRTLKISLKSAWFLMHRIREAMRTGSLSLPMGGAGSSGIVEADETFIGNKPNVRRNKKNMRSGYSHKHVVLSLVERGGKVRSVHIDDVKAATVLPIVKQNVAKEARLMTDDAGQYRGQFREYADHGVVRHGIGEYVHGDIHTNTVKNYFSVFKRGMKGVYQHCSERYLSEFDFRYSNRIGLGVDDEQRAANILQGVKGRRLTYRTPDSTA